MKAFVFAFALLALLATVYASTECPEVDGEEAVSALNPADCSTFYKCESGAYILVNCPAGLEYNKELGVCDWPENAQCVASANAEEEEASADAEEEEASANAEEAEAVFTECPLVDGEVAVSALNPADCSTFYKCESGVYILVDCPAGLEFNQALGVCDWPERARCVASAVAEEENEK